ncbi:hypothetical protein GCM10007887_24050 [Methylobacterium haplocladii]|uniref:Uncharacterized protein n=2 Tax=Methylobacterium haplocladii TaxID=1176176 RepID=A0A512IPG2_9HYPH|nr:hypothetical protein [Methylobacterium haplocladii]GEO99528.1 hypothetical protein MHA02_19160 [Methylobacterium haplocladii]GJD83671.1 hypothetical protein HPGCJGGD_1541 [Methylobacterium haplocladii]GLS59733.1 hypothetical protein GCM10007887_24050 [Methylobacterium haplocladii]
MTTILNEDMCPVPLELLGALYRADPEQLDEILDGIAEPTRARLAVYLYGRSHTHGLGLKVAAGCEGSTLRRACGLIGNVLFEQSRRNPVMQSFGSRILPSKRVSLGGSRNAVGLRA